MEITIDTELVVTQNLSDERDCIHYNKLTITADNREEFTLFFEYKKLRHFITIPIDELKVIEFIINNYIKNETESS